MVTLSAGELCAFGLTGAWSHGPCVIVFGLEGVWLVCSSGAFCSNRLCFLSTMPPYFSLKPPVVDTSSESESSSDSDDSLPRLQTCPGVGQPAASKLTSISNISRVLNSPKVSNAREEYFFAGTDPFSPKADSNVPELKTPRPVVQPKPSHLMQNSNISSTGKSSASLSLLKTPKPAAPKSTPSLAQPKPSTSRSDSEPWMRPSIITKFLETPSSEGSSDVGGNEYMPQDGLLDAKPILPEWDGLLFGGSENYCDEILAHPEVDTCFVNSKLAEDVALNYVTSYDMPVAGFMRDFHFNKVSHALVSYFLFSEKLLLESFSLALVSFPH